LKTMLPGPPFPRNKAAQAKTQDSTQ